jgi:hypothetical protein
MKSLLHKIVTACELLHRSKMTRRAIDLPIAACHVSKKAPKSLGAFFLSEVSRVPSLLPPPAAAPSYPNAWTEACISEGPVGPIVGIAIVRPVVRPIPGVAIVRPIVVRPIPSVAVVRPVDVRPVDEVPVDVVPVSMVPIAPGFRRCRGEEGCGREDGRRRTQSYEQLSHVLLSIFILQYYNRATVQMVAPAVNPRSPDERQRSVMGS